MALLNNFASRFRKGLPSASPFTSLGLEWCPRCKGEVLCDTRTWHRGTIYAYKRWCRRCGRVIKQGVYDNVPVLKTPLPADVVTWVGQDETV